MFQAIDDPFLIADDGTFDLAKQPHKPPKGAPGKRQCKRRLLSLIEELDDLQRCLYADDRYAVLLIFQAMDAAGKDGTIRAVLSGINPAGCQVFSFKQPNSIELDHDFLWRCTSRLPERGRIGVFNRSYYEEVLVVRVHPEYLRSQKLPDEIDLQSIWKERFQSIRDHEMHLAKNGVVILKFWLNVSKQEQKNRFLSRVDEPEKNWKFSSGDVRERQYWDHYMAAYQEALNATSRAWAPWYAIPADDKPYMRYRVAEIITENLRKLDIKYPKLGKEQVRRLAEMRSLLENEGKN